MIHRNRIITATVAAILSAACTSALYGEAIVNGNEVTFKLDAREWADKPSKVHVAGSFQGWNKDANAMADADLDNVWELTTKIEGDGEHQYKFVVDGDRWITDPTGDKELEIEDTYGGRNSGLIIGFDIRKAPPAQPNEINAQIVRHDPTKAEDADYLGDGRARLRLRLLADDAQRVEVQPVNGSVQSLNLVGRENGMDVFAGVVEFSPGGNAPGGDVQYSFRLIDGTAAVTYQQSSPADAPFSLKAAPVIRTPEWAKQAVWYQIFPERFRNGDSSNDPGNKPGERLIRWQADWWKAQAGEAPGDENFYQGDGNVWKRRYGGDIAGLKQSLPYLREVGINAIYLNPMFEAESMHKYDTSDFRHIDDNFGVKGDIAKLQGETDDPATWQWTESDKMFLNFLDEAHKQGFKVVIDGVFNHTGRAHPFFMDVLEKGKNSKYADWFEITEWGDPKNWRKMEDPFEVHGKEGGIRWKAWDQESGHLPVFRKDETLGLAKGPRDHIFAITKRWLAPDGDVSRGIDGWRLDVPGDIPHPFWRDWRKLVKGINPDAYITGEIWPWAQPWLNAGDQFDAVMNYQFAMPAQEFFVNTEKQIKPSEFSSRLNRLQMAYPFEVSLAQMNLFDSHDTDRLASMFVNPDRPYDAANRPQDNAADWPYSDAKPTDEQWQRLMGAATLQYTYVGSPMIYYGTEAGMWSPDDPSNRQPMVWRDLLPYDDTRVTFNDKLFTHFQRLGAIRVKFDALRDGMFVPVVAHDDQNVLAYRRSNGKQNVYVVVNRSGEERNVEVPLAEMDHDAKLVNWLDESQAKLNPAKAEEPTARPPLSATGEKTLSPVDGKLTVTLPPWGTAVLAE